MKEYRKAGHLSPPRKSSISDIYWKFAFERQEIFFKRLSGIPMPWTKDEILQSHKFTNAYRASDRVSQYLIKNVIYKGDQSPSEIFFRVMLFKVFNKIDTWILLERSLDDVSFATYRYDRYAAVLESAIRRGTRIFSGAYIMPPGQGDLRPRKKYQAYLKLIERMVYDEVPSRLTECKSMCEAFKLLRSYPMLGNFLAFQFLIDLNYSNLLAFDEMDFVVAGPGALSGIKKCFDDLGDYSPEDIIRLVTESQELEFNRLGLRFWSLWGRPLQLVDCQNLFCEVDKYARIRHPEVSGLSGRTRIKQKFRANLETIEYWYPPKWGVNDKICL